MLLLPLWTWGICVAGAQEPPTLPARGDLKPATGALPAGEKEARDLVKAGAADPKATGTALFLKDKRLLAVSPLEAASRAVEANLAIQYQAKQTIVADATVSKAKSAFDTQLSFAVSWGQTDTYLRQDLISRQRYIGELQEKQQKALFDKLFGPNSPMAQQAAFSPVVGSVNIDGQTYKLTGGSGIDPIVQAIDYETPSSRAMGRTKQAAIGMSHLLPWGTSLNASIATTWFKTLLPEGIGFQRPWTTNYSATVTFPVPFCKDFGKYGSAEANVRIARSSQNRVLWGFCSTVNSTLLQADKAYWNLVAATKNLEVTVEVRRNLEELAQKTDALFGERKILKYDQELSQAELARVRGLEESAWAAYAQASNALRSILNLERDVALMPVDYVAGMKEVYSFKPDEALQTAMERNPDVRASQADVETARFLYLFQENQARPDIKIVAGMSYTQDSSVFGYDTLAHSLSRLGHPDKKDHFVGLRYHVPWGNEPGLDRKEQANQALKQAEKTLGLVANQVERIVSDAVSGLASRKKSVEIAKRNLEAVEKAYDTAKQLWGEGRTATGAKCPAFEMLRKLNEVLSVRLALIQAQVELKKAEQDLMAAQGVLYTKFSSALKMQIRTLQDPGKLTTPAAVAEQKGGGQ